MDLYEELASTEQGRRQLASARLRERALEMLDEAMERTQVSQAELARRVGHRRNAVNQIIHGDGNFKLSTLAEYLAALGCELDLELFEFGELRNAEIEDRAPHTANDAPSHRAHGRGAIVYSHSDPYAANWDEEQRLLSEGIADSTWFDAQVLKVVVRRERDHA